MEAHKTIDDRADAARKFIEIYQWKWPMVLDGIDNAFDALYAPWPIRFYGIVDGKLEFISEPESADIDLLPVSQWLHEGCGVELK